MRGHRQRRFARSWIWAALAIAIGFPVILSTGLAGALAGTLFGARGTAVVGLLFTGVTAWIGACLFLAAPRATFAAGPLQGRGPMGRPVMVAVGIALFGWGGPTVAGALAGTLFGARGTAVVGLLFTGVTAWIGACLFLAAPRATFAAGPLKGSGPMGRLVMVAVGIALFVWGVLNSAELGVDAIRDPAVANISSSV